VRIVTSIAGTRAVLDAVRREGGRVGLVPTMGYLHEGHASLIDRARADGTFTLVTIFVNPLQFGPTEDLAAYPRDLAHDTAVCEAHGADLVLVPSEEEMYPVPVLTTVAVAGLSAPMEGASRPTHFSGVATVVAKLFAIAGDCRAYFGEKDWQQLCVVRRMAADLSLPVEVIGCPIVREPDGLARSSRNVYLGETERSAAPVLHRALLAGRDAVLAGERSAVAVTELMAAMIDDQSLAQLDYVAVVDAETLEVVEPLGGELRLLAAARFGRARLLDNVGVVAG
jgi:pantoate--beta-alanine ligase